MENLNFKFFYSVLLVLLLTVNIFPTVLDPVAPDYRIRDVRILDRNTVQVYVWNAGGNSDYIEWKLNGFSGWVTLDEDSLDMIDGSSQTSNKHLFLVIPTNYFLTGTIYTFYIRGENGSGSNQADFQFSELFYNDISTWNINFPILSASEINGLSDVQFQKTILYSNRLGKKSQAINYRLSPSLKDIVTPIGYDEFALPDTTYLPYMSSNDNGGYRANVFKEQRNFYNDTPPAGSESTTKPYSVKVVEQTPLLRIEERGFAGEVWQPGQDHTINSYNMTNSQYYEVLVLNLEETQNGTNIFVNGNYLPGELYINKVKDENNVVSYIVKDRNGLEIQKRTELVGDDAITYYVYDKVSNLRFIISPEGSELLPISGTIDANHDVRKYWTTEFKYDGLNREVCKIMPEEDSVFTVYDPAGRVILRQDGIMRANNDWLFTKYDRRGRIIINGIYHNPLYTSRISMQNHIDQVIGPGNAYDFFETHSNTSDYLEFYGYTDNAFPPLNSGWTRPWTINYYDDYDFDNDDETINVEFENIQEFNDEDHQEGDYWVIGHTYFDRIDDKLTMKKVRVFGSGGTSLWFEGNESYDYNPPSPQTIYYKGNVTLLPGFHSYEDQELHIGPNIVVPSGTPTEENHFLETAYFYDKYGRVIQTIRQNQLDGTDLISTQYEFAGKVIRTIHSHSSEYHEIPVKVTERFTYDHAGRLIDSYHKINDATEQLVSNNDYNELGQLITKNLHSIDGGFLQTIDYRYNIRGWLKLVNDPYNLVDPVNSNDDVFAFKLLYHDDEEDGVGITPSYNGNISALIWKDPSISPLAYNYEFDKLNRLQLANYSQYSAPNWAPSDEYKVYNIDYDLNGNIKTISRNKNKVDGVIKTIDILTYSYELDGGIAGNKLYSVEDAATETWGMDFTDNGSHLAEEFLYDANGNMTEDKNKCITVDYNYMNLPETITWTDGRKIEWMYDATGAKLRKTVFNSDGEAEIVKDYINGYVYETNFGDALPELSFFATKEGRVVITGSTFDYQYWLKDHLGNVRVAFRNNSGTAEVIQRDFYYPFGMTVSFGITGDENKFKYNGKELEDDHGLNWYHYGARYYDPALGRWHTMDPADEFMTPYCYVGNNPINFIDPDGAQAWGDAMVEYRIRQTLSPEGLAAYEETNFTVGSIAFGILASGALIYAAAPYAMAAIPPALNFLQNNYQSLQALYRSSINLQWKVNTWLMEQEAVFPKYNFRYSLYDYTQFLRGYYQGLYRPGLYDAPTVIPDFSALASHMVGWYAGFNQFGYNFFDTPNSDPIGNVEVLGIFPGNYFDNELRR